jgi:hypothetical protein
VERTKRSPAILRIGIGCCALVAFVLLAFVGCGGAPEPSETDAAKQAKEKPKPPFDRLQITPEPNERVFIDAKEKGSDVVTRLVKPGHWANLLVTTTANRFDFSGELNLTPLNTLQHAIPLEGSPWILSTRRGAALAKGQRKTLEAVFFPPCSLLRGSTIVSGELANRGRSDQSVLGQELLQHMPAYQYFLCVLAREPRRYSYWKTLDCVRLAQPWSDVPEETSYYRVLMPRMSQPFPLPTSVLCWTSLAVIAWDDFSPSALSGEQQRALVDWLHWGGSIIISGPQSLDTLAGSFLEPYLPAASAGAVELDDSSFAELNAHWAVGAPPDEPEPLRAAKPWSAIRLRTLGGGELVPGTGELVALRRVGRGRVVATAFRLSERELVRWRSFDSFANNVLLGRLPRRYNPAEDGFDFVVVDAEDPAEALQPELSTGVRFFTRDADRNAARPPTDHLTEAALQPSGAPSPFFRQGPAGMPIERDPLDIEMDQFKSAGGIAAWNDFSGAAEAARLTLRESAGISVPDRALVLWMLGGYLLVVGPLNWLVFWTLGRVEWAWAAVPVLAVAGGGLVIWLTQLDIGFARSHSEIDVVELHQGFDRGHLTRYAALYTSLSTPYRVQFAAPGVLAQPFSAGVELLEGQTNASVTLETGASSELLGFAVSSNSTGMIHSEQMIDLGGSIRWRQADAALATIENGTKMSLDDSAVIRRATNAIDGSALEVAWIGALAPGASAVVEFARPADSKRELRQRRAHEESSGRTPSQGGLSPRRLVELAENHESLEPGETRLVACMPEGIDGMTITPASPQARRATLVIVNLQLPNRSCRPDFNLHSTPRDVDPEVTPIEESPTP